ncbi:MAG: WGR domain-containing protein [Sandaracinus sp.]
MGAPGEPEFPDDFEIKQRAVLQWTDIASNHNKYYAIEQHTVSSPAKKGGPTHRVFTHYGRTDDLETNPNAGAKESRYFEDAAEAANCYAQIFREKTNKGYQEVSLASSKIGSHKARGQSSGAVDQKTLERIEGAKEKRAEAPVSALSPDVQRLVRYLYDEATNALTTTVAAKITANGIETPLGVLTISQIEKGEAILKDLYDLFTAATKKGAKGQTTKMAALSSDFYSTIPHRIGRSRDAVAAATISTLADFEAKQETLQLMKDMLQVNGDAGDVLFHDEIDAKYKALQCEIGTLTPAESKSIKELVEGSQIKTKSIRVKNVFRIKRPVEHEVFETTIGNERLLFHGSRIKNWVGILSRGILLPKIVVSLGVNRTDAGWLGNGLYFGDASCTSSFYTTPGREKTRFMAVATVALGKQAQFKKITYGLNAAPDGFDSSWGVRNKAGAASEFADDEYVVYRTSQQRLDYLVEFTS